MNKAINMRFTIYFFWGIALFAFSFPKLAAAQQAAFGNATIVAGSSMLTNGEKAAINMLTEEVQKRTGLKWKTRSGIPADGNVIILKKSTDKLTLPNVFTDLPDLIQKPESFRIAVSKKSNRTILLIEGFDSRGEFF